jgi:hypothetical protein
MVKVLSFLALTSLLLPLPGSAAVNLASQLSGRIVLAVQEQGEAWYVDPLSLQRTFLGRPDDAFEIMKSYGLGITKKDLELIPEVGSALAGDWNMRQRLAGRILLQVQERGEAWYVDPVSLRRVYLGRPADAFAIMTSYGLGIASHDLALIPMRDDSNSPITNTVPFVAQAPLGEWSDPRQQDGCEEASVLMAVAWARGEGLTTSQAKNDIVAMSDWQQARYGYYQDTGIVDTAERLVNEYVGFTNYELDTQASTDELIEALEDGHVVILPINGQVFEPFYYVAPGPLRHMIVVHGYDSTTQTFSVHDPGTSRGADLQVTREVLERSWQDYASGEQVPIPTLPDSMIIIKK